MRNTKSTFAECLLSVFFKCHEIILSNPRVSLFDCSFSRYNQLVCDTPAQFELAFILQMSHFAIELKLSLLFGFQSVSLIQCDGENVTSSHRIKKNRLVAPKVTTDDVTSETWAMLHTITMASSMTMRRGLCDALNHNHNQSIAIVCWFIAIWCALASVAKGRSHVRYTPG